MKTQATNENAEDDVKDGYISIAVALAFTIPVCLLCWILWSNILSYKDGLGEFRNNPFYLLLIIGLILILIVCNICGTAIRLSDSWKALGVTQKSLIIGIMAVNIAALPLSFFSHEPGYKAHMRGFAERTTKKFTVNDEMRNWIKEESKRGPNDHIALNTCPEHVQKSMAGLTDPWSSWHVSFDQIGTARFTTGGGLDYPWGLIVNLHDVMPPSDTPEDRIPLTKEVCVFHRLRD